MIWETARIHSLIAEAMSIGWSEIALASPREAELFRHAIYNRLHRQRFPITISISDKTVKISRRPQI